MFANISMDITLDANVLALEILLYLILMHNIIMANDLCAYVCLAQWTFHVIFLWRMHNHLGIIINNYCLICSTIKYYSRYGTHPETDVNKKN